MPDRPLLHSVLELLPDGAVIVETGMIRQPPTQGCDGASTVIFLDWCHNHDGQLISIDISPDVVHYAYTHLPLEQLPRWIGIHGDGAEWLADLDGPVNLLYLDSRDYNPDNPILAQEQCREEYLAARHLLTAGSYLLVDDADLPGGGKPGLLEPLLAQDGWELIGADYQKLWVKT